MYGLGLFFVVWLFTCKHCLYKQIKMLLHDLSWIPISVQSFISLSHLVFEIRIFKLNDNNNRKKNWLSWINQVLIMWYKPFLGYMLFVTIRICLMCQNLDLIETESVTHKSQMYGHNAGWPVTSLYPFESWNRLLWPIGVFSNSPARMHNSAQIDTSLSDTSTYITIRFGCPSILLVLVREEDW